MKSTFSVIFFLRRERKKSDGTCPILCRITVDKEDTRFSTKIHIKEARWNTKANKASGNSQESKNINAILDDIKASLHRIYHNLQRFDIVTAEKIKGEFLGLDDSAETILSLFDKHNTDMKALVGISKAKATLQKYKVTRKHLANFIKKKHRVSDMAVKSRFVIKDLVILILG